MLGTPLNPLTPVVHPAYTRVLFDKPDRLPADTRATVERLLRLRASVGEEEVERVDSEIVAATCWFALRPDELAAAVMNRRRWRSPVTVQQATVILAALGEAGFPLLGNGAPEPDDPDWPDHPPLRGAHRDRLIWDAAAHWAGMAARGGVYVSLGDCRGFMPRAVQFDEPGTVHPSMRAALTLGPAGDRGMPYDPVGYMRQFTRRLILVRPQE